jgi:hypothetical protein
MNNIIQFPHPRVSLRTFPRSKFAASYSYEAFDEDARAAREHAEYWDHVQYLEDAGYLL